jgi:hypothetical protein
MHQAPYNKHYLYRPTVIMDSMKYVLYRINSKNYIILRVRTSGNVTRCGSMEVRRCFWGTYRLLQGRRVSEARDQQYSGDEQNLPSILYSLRWNIAIKEFALYRACIILLFFIIVIIIIVVVVVFSPSIVKRP